MLSFEQIGQSSNSAIFKIFKDQKPTKMALKMINHDKENGSIHSKECTHLLNEYNILNQLKHKNIIKVHAFHQNQGRFCAMELQLAKKDFYSLIEQIYPKTLKASYIRNTFRQIAQAVGYLHQLGISHNDIKLENILLIDDFNPKLADFGFARTQQQQQLLSLKQQKKEWQNRSNKYLAPEILGMLNDERGYGVFDEKKSDVFAFGVTLFSAFFLRTPYVEKAERSDQMYKYFYLNQQEKFWKSDELFSCIEYLKDQEDIMFPQLKDLIEKMIEVDPSKRITMEEVINHEWFKVNNF